MQPVRREKSQAFAKMLNATQPASIVSTLEDGSKALVTYKPLTISNCTVDVGGTFLSQTQGDFATASAGGLLMNSTSATVQIAGNATFGGTRSALSAGQLAVLGNFHQTGSGTFAPIGFRSASSFLLLR